MSELGGVEQRIDSYFDAIVKMARHGALAGRPGSWADVTAQAAKASRRWRTTEACHPRLHAYYLEFVIWSEILRACVLPDRLGMLGAAIHRIGAEESGDDAADLDALLAVLCPEDHAGTSASAQQKPRLEELAVLKQLQEAARCATVSALHSALRATVLLAQRLGEDAGAGHPRCEPWPVLTVSWVLTRALWEMVPHAHRTTLARMVQLRFFELHCPGEREPEFFDQTPEIHVPPDADPRWPFAPAWRFVPHTQRGEDPLDPGPEPWLVEDLEAWVRRGIEETLGRKQDLDRELALLASGHPIDTRPPAGTTGAGPGR